MTSQEIKNSSRAYANDRGKLDLNWSMVYWQNEIAYQLAVMNERNASGDEEAVQKMLKKVGLGSPVRQGSESEVRGECPECEHVHRYATCCGTITSPPDVYQCHCSARQSPRTSNSEPGSQGPPTPKITLSKEKVTHATLPKNANLWNQLMKKTDTEQSSCPNCTGLPTGPDPRTVCAVCRRPIAQPVLPGGNEP